MSPRADTPRPRGECERFGSGVTRGDIHKQACRARQPRTRLFPEDLAEVDSGLLEPQGAIERCCPPGRQRDQRAVPLGGPPLEGAHQGPADAATALLATDEDLLNPAHRAVGIEGAVPEAQQVTQTLFPVDG